MNRCPFILPLFSVSVSLFAASAGAQVLFTSQTRTISAKTTADNVTTTVDAQGFAPFITTAQRAVPFTLPSGVQSVNTAVSTINCIVDPNKVRATGKLGAQGGNVANGNVTGSAKAIVAVSFTLSTAKNYQIVAAPRPSDDPNDDFLVEITDDDAGGALFSHGAGDPPAIVATSGTLAPGRYTVKFRAQLSRRDVEQQRDFAFELRLPTSCGLADIAQLGGAVGGDGQLTVDDLLVYVGAFFAGDTHTADIVGLGGTSAPDGAITSDDLIAYLAMFFAGCQG
jgi:hypothetical protein